MTRLKKQIWSGYPILNTCLTHMGYPIMINVFKVAEGDISKKDYKNKLNFFQKKAKHCFIQENFLTHASGEMNIFTQTEDQYKNELYLNIKNYDNIVAIT